MLLLRPLKRRSNSKCLVLGLGSDGGMSILGSRDRKVPPCALTIDLVGVNDYPQGWVHGALPPIGLL